VHVPSACHAELGSASRKTLKQVQGDTLWCVRIPSPVMLNVFQHLIAAPVMPNAFRHLVHFRLSCRTWFGISKDPETSSG
jgi:hypothetical protein